MTYPILEQIAQAMLTQLQGLTEAGGYNFTLASAERPTRYSTWKPTHLAALLTQSDPVPAEESTFDEDHWTCEFQVHAALRVSDSSSTPIDTLINVLGADLIKALCADRTFGNLADSLDILKPLKWQEDGFAGVTVSCRVHYQHAKGDPYPALEDDQSGDQSGGDQP